jgi:energy-coupling factor transporter ATP-binding protein EcfA2
LIATHDLEDVITYADRLILMKDGIVVKDGRPENLIDDLNILGIREPRAVRFGSEIP